MDDRLGHVLGALLAAAHKSTADDLPHVVASAVNGLGGSNTLIYLSDIQQRVLIPFPGPEGPALGQWLDVLPIEATLAGRSYQRGQPLYQAADVPGGGTRLWLPLLEGSQRLGLLSLVLDDAGPLAEELLGPFVALASVVAGLVATKTLYSDTLVRLRRIEQMGLAAEMQWGLLPPLELETPSISVAGALEPAYDVAGDSLDYAVDSHSASLAIFDGMGHGLQSAQLSAVAITAYRSARRAGRSLTETVTSVDDAIGALYLGDAFTTAVFAHLELESGLLTWASAGHHDPLLLRGTHVVKTLHAGPSLPCGLNSTVASVRAPIPIGTEQLEPGDHVLFYTDGVIEARTPEGDFFGIDRLCDLVGRSLSAGFPTSETVRALVREILAHQQGQLDDDATVLLATWQG
jgi:hypothetical protein